MENLPENEIDGALACLDQMIGDPSQGLPEAIFRFVSSIVPMINVDLLIQNKRGQTLLTWRDDEFYPPGWHVPGGIIRYKETAVQRIGAVAANELGTRVMFDNKPLAINEIITEPGWRIRGHFISLLYRCELIEPPTVKRATGQGLPKPGQWEWHGGCPEALLSVHEIYRQYFNKDKR